MNPLATTRSVKTTCRIGWFPTEARAAARFAAALSIGRLKARP